MTPRHVSCAFALSLFTAGVAPAAFADDAPPAAPSAAPSADPPREEPKEPPKESARPAPATEAAPPPAEPPVDLKAKPKIPNSAQAPIKLKVQSPTPVNIYEIRPLMDHPCTAPCDTTVDVQKGDRLFIEPEGPLPDGRVVPLAGKAGNWELKAKTSNAAQRISGFVLLLTGMTATVGGLTTMLIGYEHEQSPDSAADKRGGILAEKVGAGVTIGGLGVLITGVILDAVTETHFDMSPKKAAILPWIAPVMDSDGKAKGAVLGVRGTF